MSTVRPPASTAEAVQMFLTGLGYLAATDPTALAAEAQAKCLQALEQGDAARGHLGWARRAMTHPQVVMALAEGTVLSESTAPTICGWTDKIPADCRGCRR